MKRWTSSLLGLLFVSAAVVTHAQWLNYKTPGVPRTADGKSKLDAPAPRTLDGHPDLSGVWMHEPTSVEEVRRLLGPERTDEGLKTNAPGMEFGTQHKYAFNILADFKPGDSPLRPESAKRSQELAAALSREAPCSLPDVPIGFPSQGLLSEPIKIVQGPRLTMILYELGGHYRQIYVDGRRLPAEFNLPAYFGYSVGHWESDTFIVETAGFNGKTILDGSLHPESEQMRVTERFHRRDFGHLDLEMTFNDPKNYTRPFTIRVPHNLLADDDIFEMFSENEKDCAHIGKVQTK